jgi:signal transduction histidine kinase
MRAAAPRSTPTAGSDDVLHEFLTANKAELVQRCRDKVIRRSPTRHQTSGIAPFLDQLIRTLVMEQGTDPMQSRRVSGPDGGHSAPSEMGGTATERGRELLSHGYSVDEVVHDYGDLCQAITDLAYERKEAIEADEFRTVNRCLDNAIATAVVEFTSQRDCQAADRNTQDIGRRLGFLAHELRNHLTTATLAVNIMKSGSVGLSGATGQILDRSLRGLCNLIDRSLAEVRIASGTVIEPQAFALAGFIAEVKVTASLEAAAHDCPFTVATVDPVLCLCGDRDLRLAAVGNLLQNAFKFTRPGTEVTLYGHALGDRIHIEVEDNCGGLHEGDVESMFQPFVQRGADRSGAGLGLSICRRSVEAHGGRLSVRDLPGKGCVFTVNLPRYVGPAAAIDPGLASA